MGLGGCHCLCSANHPTVVGCCTADATTTARIADRDVQMCASCATATESTSRAGRALLRADEIREPRR